MSHIYRPKKPQ